MTPAEAADQLKAELLGHVAQLAHRLLTWRGGWRW